MFQANLYNPFRRQNVLEASGDVSFPILGLLSPEGISRLTLAQTAVPNALLISIIETRGTKLGSQSAIRGTEDAGAAEAGSVFSISEI